MYDKVPRFTRNGTSFDFLSVQCVPYSTFTPQAICLAGRIGLKNILWILIYKESAHTQLDTVFTAFPTNKRNELSFYQLYEN